MINTQEPTGKKILVRGDLKLYGQKNNEFRKTAQEVFWALYNGDQLIGLYLKSIEKQKERKGNTIDTTKYFSGDEKIQQRDKNEQPFNLIQNSEFLKSLFNNGNYYAIDQIKDNSKFEEFLTVNKRGKSQEEKEIFRKLYYKLDDLMKYYNENQKKKLIEQLKITEDDKKRYRESFINHSQEEINLSKQNPHLKAWILGRPQSLRAIDNQKLQFSNQSNGYYIRTVQQLEKNKGGIVGEFRYTQGKEEKIAHVERAEAQNYIVLDNVKLGELINQNQFVEYFDSKLNKEIMNFIDVQLQIPSLCLFDEQKFDFLIELTPSIELQISVPFLICKEVLHEVEGVHNFLYIQLIIPPKYYIYETKQGCYQNPLSRDQSDYVRVHNFFLTKNKSVNELTRLHLINNTTLMVKFTVNPNVYLNQYNFDSFVKVMNLNIYRKQQRIKVQIIQLHSMQYASQKDFKERNISESVKYMIYVLLSMNRIALENQTDFLNLLQDLETNELEEAVQIQILETMAQTINKQNRKQFLRIYQEIKTQKINDKQLLEIKMLLTRSTNDFSSKHQMAQINRILITPSGLIYCLKEPELKNHLLRMHSDQTDQFFRVTFMDDDYGGTSNMKFISTQYFRQLLDKILILSKKFFPLGWSASQIRNGSLWFVEGEDFRDQLRATLGNFNNIYIAAKKAARIGQSLSAGIPFRLDSHVQKQLVDDLLSPSQQMYTDGIGQISSSLIKEIKQSLHLPPSVSVLQIRFVGAKGVLTEDTTLSGQQIHIRPSMKKYESQLDKYLEILDFNRFHPGYLNRQLIILLSTLGIQDEIFMELQTEYMNNLKFIQEKEANIYTHLYTNCNYDIMQTSSMSQLIRDMMNSHIDIRSQPFVKGIRNTLQVRGYLTLRQKSNLLVNQAARIIGVIDEYKILNENEIFCKISRDEEKENTIEYVEGTVIIGQNPCLHPGDIKVLTAVSIKEVKERIEQKNLTNASFEHLLNCIVFPQAGDTPITAEISGSDLDGDLYFISWDKRLIPEQTEKPMVYDEAKASPNNQVAIQKNVQDSQILDFFIDFMNYECLGRIDNSHLVHADKSIQKANDLKCLELAQIHSQAVDYVKSGQIPVVDPKLMVKQYPDFMEKEDGTKSYPSVSILGQLYRQVQEKIKDPYNIDSDEDDAETTNQSLLDDTQINLSKSQSIIDQRLILKDIQLNQNDIKQAIQIYCMYSTQLTNELKYFEVLNNNQFQLYSGNFSNLFRQERQSQKVNFDVMQGRLLDRYVMIQSQYTKLFGNNLPKQDVDYLQNNQKVSNQIIRFSEQTLKQASLWYLVSYLKSDNPLIEKVPVFQHIFQAFSNSESYAKLKENRYIGLPWVVFPAVLFQIISDHQLDIMKLQELNQNPGSESEMDLNQPEEESQIIDNSKILNPLIQEEDYDSEQIDPNNDISRLDISDQNSSNVNKNYQDQDNDEMQSDEI